MNEGTYKLTFVVNAESLDMAIEKLDNMSFQEKLQYIKEQDHFKNLPVFVVSSSGDEWSKMYEDLGVTKYFVKSDYLMGTILKEIRSYLDRAG